MSTHNETPEEVDASAGFETSDIKISVAVWSFVILGILTVCALFATSALLRAMGWLPDEAVPFYSGSSALPSAYERGMAEPPEGAPLVQADPAAALQTLKAEQSAVLNSYGRLEAQPEIAHIAIDDVIQRIADEGELPQWEAPAQPETEPAAESGGLQVIDAAGDE